MKTKKFKERGITLIALVITIIVLLILAGVTLSILLQTGIIENSQRAVNLYQAQAKNETETMDYIQDKFGIYISYLDNINGTENKKMIEDESVGYKYYNPVVPVGFKAVNTEDASWKVVEDEKLGKIVQGWNSGLVIEDKDGNQFVWVPAYVDKMDGELIDEKKINEFTTNKVPKYEKWDGSTTYVNVSDRTNDKLPMLDSTDTNDIQAYEEKQIGTYGGFYIGRYEAGTKLDYDNRDKVATPIVKQNQKPWNHIDYYNAKASAESMYTTNEVQSVLVTGTMWDTVMKWLELNGVDNVETQTKNDAWGNYSNVEVTGVSGYYNSYEMEDSQWVTEERKPENTNGILKTGTSEFTKKKNIYDLSGNMWEYTNEKCSSDCVTRGGYYNDTALNYPPAVCVNFYASNPLSYYFSFRVGLYIK